MKLVDMAEPAPQGGGLYAGAPAPIPSNPYPWGLRINITHEQLAKLGHDELPPAGTEIHLEAVTTVVRTESCDPDADGDIDYSCIELQIKELGIEEAGEGADDDEDEDGEDASEGRAERMYAKGKQPA